MFEERMLPMKAVREMLGVSRSMVYVYIKDGELPRGVRMSDGRVCWPLSWIQDFIQQRVAESQCKHQPRKLGRSVTMDPAAPSPQLTGVDERSLLSQRPLAAGMATSRLVPVANWSEDDYCMDPLAPDGITSGPLEFAAVVAPQVMSLAPRAPKLPVSVSTGCEDPALGIERPGASPKESFRRLLAGAQPHIGTPDAAPVADAPSSFAHPTFDSVLGPLRLRAALSSAPSLVWVTLIKRAAEKRALKSLKVSGVVPMDSPLAPRSVTRLAFGS